MKTTHGFLLVSALCAGATASYAATYTGETIPGTADIYAAGGTFPSFGGGSGTAPPTFNLPSSPQVLSFSSVSGTITLNSGGGYNNPDGITVTGSENGNESSDNAFGGLSAIAGPDQGALLGVFITATSTTTLPTPAELNFNTIGLSFANLSPALDQVFFIGDGLTGHGTGSTQDFTVPAGATELVLGIGDADGYNCDPAFYGDNSGEFTASFQVTSSSVPDATSSVCLMGMALAGISAVGRRLKIAAH
jgi:hypothetical protein